MHIESRIVRILALALAAVGIIVRLQRYILGRSFRDDEAALAMAIDSHSFTGLLSRPLGGAFTAPVGFVLAEKSTAIIFGTQDFIFRLIPLLAGLLSVMLLYWLAERLVGGIGAIFCIGAFSLNWFATFYASDLKQYSSDILFALVILIAATRYLEADTLVNAWILAIAGLVAISFSHPAIFLLACVGPVLLVMYHRQPGGLKRAVAVISPWLFGFVALYLRFYRGVGQQTSIADYWNDLDGLMPIPPWNDPSWFMTRTDSFISTVLTLSPSAVALALYTIGLCWLVRRGKWQWAAWLLGAVLMTLVASAVANYPFKGRLILYLVPMALLAIGAGLEGVASLAGSHGLLRSAMLWSMVFFLLWTPATSMIGFLQQPRSAPYREDIKPALSFMQANRRASDLIVVYSQASPTYKYYAPFFGLSDNPTIFLPDYRKQPNKYAGIIDALPRNQRIWLVYSSVLQTRKNEDERQLMLDYVRSGGGQILAEQSVADGLSSAHLIVLR